MKTIRPFHLAFPVRDLKTTRAFYCDVLGCTVGRTAEKWIDFDFFGHQLSAHLKPEETKKRERNAVDGQQVPVLHWGLILEWSDWHHLAERLKEKQIPFIIEPYIRFEGEVGEQATMFFMDPSENALEFKSFKSDDQIFAKAE